MSVLSYFRACVRLYFTQLRFVYGLLRYYRAILSFRLLSAECGAALMPNCMHVTHTLHATYLSVPFKSLYHKIHVAYGCTINDKYLN